MKAQLAAAFFRMSALIFSFLFREKCFADVAKPAFYRRVRTEVTIIDAVDGATLLESRFGLSPEKLAAFIEARLSLPKGDYPDSFPYPYVHSREEVVENASKVKTLGFEPITLTPHIVYNCGVREYDFSRLVFFGNDVERYFPQSKLNNKIEQHISTSSEMMETLANQQEVISEHIGKIDSSIKGIEHNIPVSSEMMDTIVRKQEEILSMISAINPQVLDIAQQTKEIHVRTEDIHNIKKLLLNMENRLKGKDELKPVVNAVAEIFEQCFTRKKNADQGLDLGRRIIREEFENILKERFPTLPGPVIGTFWGMLASEYKYAGRPEIK